MFKFEREQKIPCRVLKCTTQLQKKRRFVCRLFIRLGNREAIFVRSIFRDAVSSFLPLWCSVCITLFLNFIPRSGTTNKDNDKYYFKNIFG